MLKLLKDLKEEWKGEYESSFTTTVEIAMNIAFFAHRGAQRVNGEAYITHPKGLADYFSYLSQINEDDFDEENLYKVGLHYQGVLEVCWMHDVIEDTPYTIEEIEEVFEERSVGDYFRTFIKRPLELITHDKSEPYPIYIEKVCKNLTASIVKFLDLYNNSNPLTLDHLGDNELKRIQDYASYMKMINDEWHLIERFNDYLDIVYMKRWQKRKAQKGDN